MRLNGATVKAALLPAARRQLFSITKDIEPIATGVVSFSGSTAYTQYFLRLGKIVSWGINYPALPDNAALTRKEADLMAGYTLHEIGHVLYTDNGVTKALDPFMFRIWNGLEDPRIEAAMIASGKSIGARSAFKRLIARHTVDIDNKGFNPCRLSDAAFALALLGRAAYGNGNGYANRLMERIPEPKRAIYEAAVAALIATPLDRRGTAVVVAIARKFVADWRAIEPEKVRELINAPAPGQDAPPPAPSDETVDAAMDEEPEAESFDDVDEGEEPIRVNPDDRKTDLGTSGPAEEMESEEPEDEPSVGPGAAGDDEADDEAEPGEESGGGSGEWDDEWDDDDEYDDLSGVPIAPPKSDEQIAADDEIAKAERNLDEAPMPGGMGGSAVEEEEVEDEVEEATFDDASDLGEVKSPELGVDDIFANIRNRVSNPVELPPTAPPARTDMTQWSSVLGLTDRQVGNDVRRLSKVAKSPALKSALARILRAPERTGRDTGPSGRFDPRKFGKMLAGSEMVMKQLWIEPGLETAVSIVIDASGSMNGEPMKLATEAGWVFAEACEAAGAAVEVIAYRGCGNETPSFGEGIDGKYRHGLPGLREADATVITIKPFRKRLNRCAGAFRFAKNLADGGTPDYTVVRDACLRLSTRTEARKIVLSITDGCGDVNEVKGLCGLSYQLFGVDVIGIGIGVRRATMERAYDDGIAIDSIDQLEGTGLKALARKLDERDTRRKW